MPDTVEPVLGYRPRQHHVGIVAWAGLAPEAFRGLLAGRNFGKLLVQVREDPTPT